MTVCAVPSLNAQDGQVISSLTLGVGRCLPGAFQTWFLAFLDTRIAGQQVVIAQLVSVFFIHSDQCTRQAEFDRITLACDAAAAYADCHVIIRGSLANGL